MKKYNDYFFKNQNKYDVIVSLADARAPFSTLDFEVFNKYSNHIHLLVLSKTDLVDKIKLKKAIDYFTYKKISTISLDLSKSLSSKMQDKFYKKILNAFKLKGRPIPMIITILVTGFPNLGKSTLINRLIEKNIAVVANRPGVTKHPQILKINEQFYVFDFPGISVKKIIDHKQWMIAALLRILPEKICETSEINSFAYHYLKIHYPDILKKIFNLNSLLDYYLFFKLIKQQQKFSSKEAVDTYIFQRFCKNKLALFWDKDRLRLSN